MWQGAVFRLGPAIVWICQFNAHMSQALGTQYTQFSLITAIMFFEFASNVELVVIEPRLLGEIQS